MIFSESDSSDCLSFSRLARRVSGPSPTLSTPMKVSSYAASGPPFSVNPRAPYTQLKVLRVRSMWNSLEYMKTLRQARGALKSTSEKNAFPIVSYDERSLYRYSAGTPSRRHTSAVDVLWWCRRPMHSKPLSDGKRRREYSFEASHDNSSAAPRRCAVHEVTDLVFDVPPFVHDRRRMRRSGSKQDDRRRPRGRLLQLFPLRGCRNCSRFNPRRHAAVARLTAAEHVYRIRHRW